ncbi:MAG: hypothetical protein CVT92_01385 [Bacteroidetes bacterium HGW-Bacteroidetes-1]|jgi:folate-dependent phosphoribosylglycinamide formyltransferase PurN|nr:MAG: hypothetical protein CVT92_01385 [Bacteroidetes bacterium HGW-Bacteroidetes-1]
MSDSFKIIKNKNSCWGGFYKPLRPKAEKKVGLRAVLFVSCNSGYLLLKNLANFEALYPEKLNIVGIVTDDPLDPDARISIKKRIWNEFTKEEHRFLFQRIIDTSIGLGIPCYSGAIKTDYFHEIFNAWNPETMLMFCFGQIVDTVTHKFPVMGSYNFHPSDLLNNIGVGSQPFQLTIKNGMKTSNLVIHEVTDVIDRGPIVGISPPVNICLTNGSYPDSILTLDDKITSVGGWMGVELIESIFSNKVAGMTGRVDVIDFEKQIPATIKAILKLPAVNDLSSKYEIPLHPLLCK